MFSRVATPFTVLFFVMFAAAGAVPRNDTPPPPPPVDSCTTGSVQCCNSAVSTTDPGANVIATLLGIVLSPVDLLVGLNCSPLDIIGVGGNSCTSQTVCCTGNNFHGLLVLGCSPLNINA